MVSVTRQFVLYSKRSTCTKRLKRYCFLEDGILGTSAFAFVKNIIRYDYAEWSEKQLNVSPVYACIHKSLLRKTTLLLVRLFQT